MITAINLYHPHPGQKKILEDDSRFKVVVCGRRFGKTVFAINELLEGALTTPHGRFWYIAPTYSQAKMIAWRMLIEKIMRLPPDLVVKRNESELYIQFSNGALLELKGADNEDNLRGVGLDGVVMDEMAIIKSHVLHEIVMPMLLDSKGWGIFISTPKGFNHFYDLYTEGLKETVTDYQSFHFSSYDNPHVDKLEIEKLKDSMDATLFEQEYLAEFTKFTGAIYKDFNRRIHVISEWRPNPGEQVYRAMDFGAVNPTVCLWIHINKEGEVIVFDEYQASEKTTQQNAGIISARYPEYQYAQTYGDPSGKQEILDYASYGLYISPAVRTTTGPNEDWVNSGINQVITALKVNPSNGRPKLFITENCTNLIRGMESYAWQEPPKSNIQGRRDVPIKIDDHHVDAYRYFAVSYRGRVARKNRRVVEVQRSSITGY